MEQENEILKIHAFLTGQLEGDDLYAFEQWRSESDENHALVEEVQGVWQAAAKYSVPEFDDKAAIPSMPFHSAEIVSTGSRRAISFNWIYRVVAIGLVAVASYLGYEYFSTDLVEVSGVNSSYIVLADGTEVFLKENAQVRYPAEFSRLKRVLQLEGEAFFNVASNPEQPFVVRSSLAEVIVLGTQFGVRAELNSQQVDVHVLEGSVGVRPTGADLELVLKEGESAIFDEASGKLQRKFDQENSIAWYTGILSFNGTPLEQVIADLEQTFEVEISLANAALAHCPLTTSRPLRDKTVKEVLEFISVIHGSSVVEVNSNKFEIHGEGCKR